MQTKRLTTNRDLADLIRKAEKQGFQVTPTGSGHLRWQAPDGAVHGSSSTPSAYTAITNHRAWLKRHGLVEVTPRELKRRARQQQERPAAAPAPRTPVSEPDHPRLALLRELPSDGPELWCKGMRWTYRQAADLLRQGYTLAYVFHRTGWGPGWFRR